MIKKLIIMSVLLSLFKMAAMQISVQDRAIEAFKKDLENDINEELVDAVSFDSFKSLISNAQTSQNTLNLAIVPTAQDNAFNYYDTKSLANTLVSYINKLYQAVNERHPTVPLENLFMAKWINPSNRMPLREIYTYKYTFEKQGNSLVKNIFTYEETYKNLYLFTLKFCDRALVPSLVSKLDRIAEKLMLKHNFYEEIIFISKAVIMFNENEKVISEPLIQRFKLFQTSAMNHLEAQKRYRTSQAPR